LLSMLPVLGDTVRAQVGRMILAGLDLTHPHGLNHERTFHTFGPLKSTHLKLVTTVAPDTSTTTTSSGLPRRVVQSFGAHTARILGSLPPAPAWAGRNGWTKCGAVSYHALLSPSRNYG